MKTTLLLGRIFFSLIFLSSLIGHFNEGAIGYAASVGVPFASIAVPLSGIVAGLGAISIILGYRAKVGAWLVVLFLLPITFMMHNFWAMTDPMMAQMHQAMFMKNLSMIGGALMIAYFGSGPLSLDQRGLNRTDAIAGNLATR